MTAMDPSLISSAPVVAAFTVALAADSRQQRPCSRVQAMPASPGANVIKLLFFVPDEEAK